MIATGEGALDAIAAAAVEVPLSAFCPASVMQLHRHVTVSTIEAAASSLKLCRLLPVCARTQAVTGSPLDMTVLELAVQDVRGRGSRVR